MDKITKPVYLKLTFLSNHENQEPQLKVLSFDPQCTIAQALSCIQSTLNLSPIESAGLYDDINKTWLEESLILKDIPKIENLDLAYRDKKKPINIGYTKERRKLMRNKSPGGNTASPYFSEWEQSLQKTENKKKEEKERAHKLKRRLSMREMNELKGTLATLASSSPEQTDKIRSSMWDNGPLEDERLKLLNEFSQMQDMLHKKEQDSAMAAEIGKVLLEKNEELEKELVIVKSKGKQIQALEFKYSELESELVRTKSRQMVLESQLQEACNINNVLMDDLSIKDDELVKRNAKLRKLAPLKDKDRVIQEQMNEIEELKSELSSITENEQKVKHYYSKLLKEKRKNR